MPQFSPSVRKRLVDYLNFSWAASVISPYNCFTVRLSCTARYIAWELMIAVANSRRFDIKTLDYT